MTKTTNNPDPIEPLSPPTAPAPTEGAQSSPAPNQPAPRDDVQHEITQHLLSTAGPTALRLPVGSRLIDVHLIDGHYYVRACVPVRPTNDDVELTIVPAALGTRLVLGRMRPLICRHGGIHFFASEN